MNMLRDDVRYVLRVLRKRPALASTALLTLALGVGANTSLFAVVSGVLLRPLPWPEADRLVQLSDRHPGGQGPLRQALLSNVTARAWGANPHTIEAIAAWSSQTSTVRLGDELSRVPGASVSPALFRLLRVSPAAGRFFDEAEAAPRACDVVVLGAALWRRRFKADLAVVGSVLLIDGRPHVVVGVAPDEFFFPDREALLWTPDALDQSDGSMTVFSALARLRPGATPAQAEAEGTAAARGGEPSDSRYRSVRRRRAGRGPCAPAPGRTDGACAPRPVWFSRPGSPSFCCSRVPTSPTS